MIERLRRRLERRRTQAGPIRRDALRHWPDGPHGAVCGNYFLSVFNRRDMPFVLHHAKGRAKPSGRLLTAEMAPPCGISAPLARADLKLGLGFFTALRLAPDAGRTGLCGRSPFVCGPCGLFRPRPWWGMFDGFSSETVEAEGTPIHVRRSGSGPPLLLLHGFPQTHAMWRRIAPKLAADFTVVCADLPGYGSSGCPSDRKNGDRKDGDGEDHAAMSKRAMALTLVGAMRKLGHERFAVAGHDRGGRVAYRAALDHPDAIAAIAVLDVIPTHEVWNRADARLALSFWPFSLLAQPAPLPERLLLADPEAVIDNALSQWGTPPEFFPAEVRRAYADALRDPSRVHAICEEYRAAAGIDREHDRADLQAGRRIAAPVLALWSAEGGLAEWYEDDGGPLGIWRRWVEDVQGGAMPGGHFFPEEHPQATATALRGFFLQHRHGW